MDFQLKLQRGNPLQIAHFHKPIEISKGGLYKLLIFINLLELQRGTLYKLLMLGKNWKWLTLYILYIFVK